MTTKLASVLALASVSGLGACAATYTPYDGADVTYVDVQPVPPAAPVEVVTVSPGPDYIWVGGGYDWVGPSHRYVWRPGRWERPPRAHAVWNDGSWRRDPHGWRYDRGHWR